MKRFEEITRNFPKSIVTASYEKGMWTVYFRIYGGTTAIASASKKLGDALEALQDRIPLQTNTKR